MDCFFGWLDMIIEEKTERRELTVDLGTVDFWTTWKWSLNVWCCGMWDSKPWVGFPSQCLLTFNGWMVLQYFFCIPRARKHRCWYIYIYISYAAAPLHTFSRLCGPIIYNTQSEVLCCRKVQSLLMCVCSKWYASVSIGNSCDCLTLKQSVKRSFLQTRSEFADGLANRSKFCSSAPIGEGGLHKDIRFFVRPPIACAIAFRLTVMLVDLAVDSRRTVLLMDHSLLVRKKSIMSASMLDARLRL